MATLPKGGVRCPLCQQIVNKIETDKYGRCTKCNEVPLDDPHDNGYGKSTKSEWVDYVAKKGEN